MSTNSASWCEKKCLAGRICMRQAEPFVFPVHQVQDRGEGPPGLSARQRLLLWNHREAFVAARLTLAGSQSTVLVCLWGRAEELAVGVELGAEGTDPDRLFLPITHQMLTTHYLLSSSLPAQWVSLQPQLPLVHFSGVPCLTIFPKKQFYRVV